MKKEMAFVPFSQTTRNHATTDSLHCTPPTCIGLNMVILREVPSKAIHSRHFDNLHLHQHPFNHHKITHLPYG